MLAPTTHKRLAADARWVSLLPCSTWPLRWIDFPMKAVAVLPGKPNSVHLVDILGINGNANARANGKRLAFKGERPIALLRHSPKYQQGALSIFDPG